MKLIDLINNPKVKYASNKHSVKGCYVEFLRESPDNKERVTSIVTYYATGKTHKETVDTKSKLANSSNENWFEYTVSEVKTTEQNEVSLQEIRNSFVRYCASVGGKAKKKELLEYIHNTLRITFVDFEDWSKNHSTYKQLESIFTNFVNTVVEVTTPMSGTALQEIKPSVIVESKKENVPPVVTSEIKK